MPDSPDLLDDKNIDAESILSVVNESGVTRIGRIDEASRTAIRDGLYTAGELLRADQLAAEPPQGREQRAFQHELFAKSVERRG